MIYEVAWTRALALVIGSSTYAFTAMLVAFLLGIGGGSALYSWLWGARRASPLTFAALQIGIGLAVVFILLVFERMPELFLAALRWSDSPTFVQFVQFVVSAGSLLLSTVLIGATFPCAVAIVASRAARIGRDVGQVYAANTLGAIIGTVLAGFVLIPSIGVHGSIKAGSALNLLLGAVLLVASAWTGPAWRWVSFGATLTAAAGVLFIPPWDQRVMSSGPAVYGKIYLQEQHRTSLQDTLRQKNLLFYRDGISSTVAVTRQGAELSLLVNGKVDASNTRDMPTQLMLGHLPLLFHPDPKAVLVLGLGGGVTAGAVARHPVERLDVLEIEPAVMEASKYFAGEHGNVLGDPRVRTVIADGRTFLLTTSDRYDVIISEPSNPWIGGIASLFSVEFYQLARERLRPGGIMLQWIHCYRIHPEDVQMVVKTFRTVFPATSLWGTAKGDLLLLGRAEATPLEMDLLKSRYQSNAAVRADLEKLGVPAWAGVLGYFMLAEKDTERFADPAGLNTDDGLPLEFSTPRALYDDTTDRNWRLIRSFKEAALPLATPAGLKELEQPEVRYWIGTGYLRRREWEDALLHFQAALQRAPEHIPSILGAGMAHLRLGRPAAALDLARKALDADPRNAQALFLAGLASETLRVPADAVSFLERAVALQPDNGAYQAALARARNGQRTQ